MTTPPTFPKLPGQGWSVTKTPMSSTTVAPHVSGRDVRVKNWANALYAFTLTFDGLASNANFPGLYANSLQMLMAFYNQVGGQFGTFLYKDDTDCYATGQVIGTGDGSTRTFQFFRTLFNLAEPVGWVSFVHAIYVNGIAQSGCTLAEPNAATPYPNVTLAAAPVGGAVVTADFDWSFVCRFVDDTQEFEQFMSNLWTVKTLKFQSVRNGGF